MARKKTSILKQIEDKMNLAAGNMTQGEVAKPYNQVEDLTWQIGQRDVEILELKMELLRVYRKINCNNWD